MRALKLLLTACGFAIFFFGMIGLSALTTSAAHWAFFARPLPLSAVSE
ncbi:MAG TPA: hypothetical protein VLL28_03675 [Hyphomicrobiaceae bacterium]|jgi:hypothetical protein|nr:hypothetical protein [Hyphomicrobiaceae bacterium]